MGTWSSWEPGLDEDGAERWDGQKHHVWVDVATEVNWGPMIRLIVGQGIDDEGWVYLTPVQARTVIGMLEGALSGQQPWSSRHGSP